jgi:glucokinase
VRLFAGFDLGGTLLKYGLVDEKGDIILESLVNTPGTMENLLQTLRDIWHVLRKRYQNRIVSAGLGFPGIFNQKEQIILQSPNYPEIDNCALIPAFSQFIDVPFWVNNEANLAAFGEYVRGAGQNTQSLVLLTIGTGVGTGIILDGKIWQGSCGYAGEMGHATVNPEGEACKCGSRGCLETEVSAPKIVKNYLYFSRLKENITSEEITRRARNNDKNALKALALAGRYLGIGISIMINLLNPEKILLGGGVMKAGNLLLEPAVKESSIRSFKGSFECCQIERASLGNKAGFIGAALWAKKHLNSDF